MSKKLDELTNLLTRLRFAETAKALPSLLDSANNNNPSYPDFLSDVFSHEAKRREEKAATRRLKQAAFPYYKTLNEFDLSEQTSLTERNFNQLKDLTWVEQGYNLVLLGPTGTGKTFLSVGLGIKAIDEGFKVVFVTMGEMVHLLKTYDISRRSEARLKRMKQADLLILDDLMFMALDKQEANLFFHFINEIYEETSIILTSNKAPNEWGQLIGDEIITGAILDRIVQKAEVIQLSGESYRLAHRKGIFEESEQ
jgi:DNA replication protein DnaC